MQSNQKKNSINSQSSSPSSSKQPTGNFFSRSPKTKQPFFSNSVIQTKPSAGTSSTNSALTPSATANPNGIPGSLRSGLEQLSGRNLANIKVHSNSSKPASYNAHAYTHGQDIYVAPGQEKYLPHEGWHAVQQLQGRVKPTIQKKGVAINDDSYLEREADVMGAKALQQSPTSSENLASPKASASPATTQFKPVIQRAMKFEYQVKDGGSITNRLFRDDGTNVMPLPRKYGPQDFLVKGASGVRLESETDGQPEFETGWKRSWSKLSAQINEAHKMTKQMNDADEVVGSDGKTYKEFPFTGTQIKHLRTRQGFDMNGRAWAPWQKGKKYESNPNYIGPDGNKKTITDAAGNTRKKVFSRDTILKPAEKILVRIRDTKWKAYIQPSESFRLDQFESYLEQMDPRHAPAASTNTNKLMSAHNPTPSPAPNFKPDDTVFQQMIKRARAKAIKTKNDTQFAESSKDLKNLVLMVVYYINMGATRSVKGKAAKKAFRLMNRTNFGSIYLSMSEAEKSLFSAMVYDNTDGLLPTMGIDRTTLFFMEGQGSGADPGPNPTVFDWLKGITEGKDLLSGAGFSGAMGKFRIENEVKKQKGLVRFEGRNTAGNSQFASNWITHAGWLFLFSAHRRPRDSGKGKTGLKL